MVDIVPLSPAAHSVPGVTKVKLTSREQWLDLRKGFVGASEIAALFGVHPYTTAAQLFETKKGRYIPNFAEAVIEEDSIVLPPTDRGLLLEAPTFELLRRLKPDWQVAPNSVPGGYYFMDKAHGLSTTPDAFILTPGSNEYVAFQGKSVADLIYRQDWFEGGMPTLPIYHAVQVTIDAALPGCSWGIVGVIVIGFTVELRLFRVRVRPELVAKARALSSEFWKRIEADERYDFDYARDAELIGALYSDDDGSMLTLSWQGQQRLGQILVERESLKSLEAQGTEAVKARKALDAEIVALLGNGTGTVLDDGRVVTAKTTRRGTYAVEPTSYRQVRIAEPGKGRSSKIKRVAAPAAGAMPDTF